MISNNQLAAIIQRVEKMEDEKAAISIDISEIYKEAKGNGFDTKILRKIVADRKKPQHKRDDEKAIYDLYMSAIESFEMTPLGKFAAEVEA